MSRQTIFKEQHFTPEQLTRLLRAHASQRADNKPLILPPLPQNQSDLEHFKQLGATLLEIQTNGAANLNTPQFNDNDTKKHILAYLFESGFITGNKAALTVTGLAANVQGLPGDIQFLMNAANQKIAMPIHMNGDANAPPRYSLAVMNLDLHGGNNGIVIYNPANNDFSVDQKRYAAAFFHKLTGHGLQNHAAVVAPADVGPQMDLNHIDPTLINFRHAAQSQHAADDARWAPINLEKAISGFVAGHQVDNPGFAPQAFNAGVSMPVAMVNVKELFNTQVNEPYIKTYEQTENDYNNAYRTKTQKWREAAPVAQALRTLRDTESKAHPADPNFKYDAEALASLSKALAYQDFSPADFNKGIHLRFNYQDDVSNKVVSINASKIRTGDGKVVRFRGQIPKGGTTLDVYRAIASHNMNKTIAKIKKDMLAGTIANPNAPAEPTSDTLRDYAKEHAYFKVTTPMPEDQLEKLYKALIDVGYRRENIVITPVELDVDAGLRAR